MEAQLEVVTPEVKENTERGLTPEQITKNALAVVNQAKDIVIITVDDYSFADLMFKEVKGWINKLDKEEKKITKPLLEGIENARALFRGPKQRANDVKEILNTRMTVWADEQKRKEKAEEKRLQEEARKRAEEETLRNAIELEEEGFKVEAEAIMSEPVYVPPIKVVSEIPKSKGTFIRETWSAEVTDLETLFRGIRDGKAPLQCLMPDMTFLNGQARAYKQALNIPGVRAVSKKTQI